MKAASISPRSVTLVDVGPPEPGSAQVRIRLEGCGVCASNLAVWEGRPWFTYPLDPGAPGHEGWGVVDKIGDAVDGVNLGERVAFLSGRAYAEYDLAESDALVRIPDALAQRRFPGEAIGCAMNIFRRSDIAAGQTVAIIGAGFLGNLLIQLAKSAGARVVAISRRDAARELAKACGADETIAMRDHGEIVGRMRELTDGRGAERVLECVGAQWPLDIANDIIGERGRLVIAGYHQDGPRQVNMQNWNWLGLDVINAHERDPRNYVRGMQDAVDAVLRGTIDPELLLTNDYALDELGRALDDVEQRPDRFVKGTILF
ncbi:MAG: zinc-binding dehydrogenase [Acidobacteria bacterium]|nr:zinc-binding dehydrogenase [Acidobacteriota bacterium]MBV9477002.1 zinc-binding dehydrogenase [Acidobacteriota bacterium]